MIEFGLGFLCCAVLFIYVNWRTRKPEEKSPTIIDKIRFKPDNKRARYCSTDQYRAEQKWLREHGKKQ
jgi:hypothetical protein